MQTTLSIGTELKSPTIRYRIEAMLGQGAFGVTYKAKGYTTVKGALGEMTMELPNYIAIKEFFMRDINQRGVAGEVIGMTQGSLAYNYAVKFRKEAENLARMKHPNIVKVIDFIEANNTFYYVMEYVDGEDMNSYLKNHHLSEEEAITIIQDVANALMYMHEEQHMLHLDLKPGNIMRRKSDGHIFLIDFGLSKHYGEDGNPDTSTTIGLGTEGYAPIEQGKRTNSRNDFLPTIDIYALGATFFKLLTGSTPPSASDVLGDEDIIPDELRTNGISQTVIDVVVKAIQPVAKKRIQTVRGFIEQLPQVGVEKSSAPVNVIVQKEPPSKPIQIKEINWETLDEETRLNFSEEEQNRIILAGKNGILNQPSNQLVDLGLSVYWYNTNLVAMDASDSGEYISFDDPLIATYITNVQGNSRVPTTEEWEELINKCQWTWIEEYNCSGYLVKGPSGKCIFLPAGGKKEKGDAEHHFWTYRGVDSVWGDVKERDFEGYYWANDKTSPVSNYVNRIFKFTYPPKINVKGMVYESGKMAYPIRLVSEVNY